ncbi:hypothetical protein [Pseudomonas sp.]|uniref:hypothetical protein n=1 Tax=Pseudomonas sp. TaxID=306 RepID=UPI003D0DEAF6
MSSVEAWVRLARVRASSATTAKVFSTSPISLGKVGGIVLVFAGVWLIRRG